MKVHIKHVLDDGSALALLQFCPNSMRKMGLRLVKLRPGLDAVDVRRIDQRGGD
jgi:hypothetical protein